VPARLRLALMVLASCVLLAALAVVVFAKPNDEQPVTSSGFDGSLRPDIVPTNFTLTDQDGRTVSLASFKGRPLILTFMYSTCKDTCPLQANQIRGALDQLGDDAVPAVAISVDPKNDTEDRAKRFIVQKQLNGRMQFLLGSRAQLAPIWKEYGIQPQGKAFDHTAYVVILDSKGRQRVSFPVAKLTPEGLAHDVRVLQREDVRAASAAAAASARSTAAT
jgi:protein SCO1